jgi:hypothetical protein
MGPKETQQMYIRTCIDRSAIVALSAEPPGVNELCVCNSSVPTHLFLLTTSGFPNRNRKSIKIDKNKREVV